MNTLTGHQLSRLWLKQPAFRAMPTLCIDTNTIPMSLFPYSDFDINASTCFLAIQEFWYGEAIQTYYSGHSMFMQHLVYYCIHNSHTRDSYNVICYLIFLTKYYFPNAPSLAVKDCTIIREEPCAMSAPATPSHLVMLLLHYPPRSHQQLLSLLVIEQSDKKPSSL